MSLSPMLLILIILFYSKFGPLIKILSNFNYLKLILNDLNLVQI
ncbi:hypothetical protein BSV1_A107 (plasmid) [Borreliella finlandensis]|uniref:Uncharacterized protein n=2 Tax=Borreliella TaxID=64895 RepID=A0A7U3YBS4_BORBG|nr:hypothetical protein Bbu156a_A56 [Borreliella burgdorferi 156a]ACM10100.1 hypothetical protein BBU72A_A0059 [Borreliella burgdorferi 72a]ACN93117.1 hypothetical protein BBU118A_A56 [Borreliella burgdorferi 118a]ACN93563.1 hypothetical protein BSV1_A107 [Borreliella finlandensis]